MYKVYSLHDPDKDQYYNWIFNQMPHLDNPTKVKPFSIIKDYTRYYDEVINTNLRENKPVSTYISTLIKTIVEEVDRSPAFDNDVILFRGIELNEKFTLEDLEVGKIIHDPGFTSKSATIQTALEFATHECCLLVIHYPPGSKHISLEEISYYEEEDEHLTYPGEIFTVTDAMKIEGSSLHIFMLTYVGNDYDFTVDDELDKKYEKFRLSIASYLHRAIYFEKANMVMSPEAYIFMAIPDDSLKKFYTSPGMETSHDTKDKEDKLYTLYMMDRVKPMYYLPDLEELLNFLILESIEAIGEVGKQYVKGRIGAVSNSETGESVQLRRFSI